jgi:hypothetical protein
MVTPWLVMVVPLLSMLATYVTVFAVVSVYEKEATPLASVVAVPIAVPSAVKVTDVSGRGSPLASFRVALRVKVSLTLTSAGPVSVSVGGGVGEGVGVGVGEGVGVGVGEGVEEGVDSGGGFVDGGDAVDVGDGVGVADGVALGAVC